MTLTIDKFGRILIPKGVRDRLGLAPGTALELDIRETGEGGAALELRPEREEPALRRRGRALLHAGRLPETFDPASFLQAQRDERTHRLAGLGE